MGPVMAQPTDVVVPAHDEAAHLAGVLDAVAGSPEVGQIVVVADRCTDATADIAQRYGTVVTIGAGTKGMALAAGLQAVGSERVVFIDGDLVGLAPQHVTALCIVPPLDGQVVGVRGALPGGRRVARATSVLPSISGERRLPTAFARMLRLSGRGWQTETYINAQVAAHQLPHRQIVLRGVANPSETRWAKRVGEWGEIAAAGLLWSPELARYSWGLE